MKLNEINILLESQPCKIPFGREKCIVMLCRRYISRPRLLYYYLTISKLHEIFRHNLRDLP